MQDFSLSAYDYALPENLIAQNPPKERGDSRLLLLPKSGPVHCLREDVFASLGRYLPPNSLLLANNTSVLPARLFARKKTGGKVEFLLLTPLPLLQVEALPDGRSAAVCEGLIRPAARVRTGERLAVGEDLEIFALEKGEFGRCQCRLVWRGDQERLFRENGQLPLPPYIRRQPGEQDCKRYQTVFAKHAGAAAAPTAGLHFTKAHLRDLASQGHQLAEVTLHVGYGTFTPVRCGDIRQHRMHKEYAQISPETAAAMQKARKEERSIIAIGTTSLRAVEGMFQALGEIAPFSGFTDIFLYPGKRTSLVDGLLTNFHLPRSSLLMLVSAIAGRERVLAAYSQAIERGFRFFSYGDAMLIY